MLGRGRSFRTRRLDQLIRAGADRLNVLGEVDVAGRRHTLGVSGSQGRRMRAFRGTGDVFTRRSRRRISGADHRSRSSSSHRGRPRQASPLSGLGSVPRGTWFRGELVAVWDANLVQYGEVLTDARHRYVEQLAAIAGPLGQCLLGKELSLAYRNGWTRELPSLRRWLEAGAPARPTLLLDDPAAELDDERLARLIEEVRAQLLQLIVTTLHSEFSALGIPGRSFRIEGGALRPS